MPYDELSAEPLTEPDTDNHTKFYPTDSAAEFSGRSRLDETATYAQHYTRLALLNTGIFTGKWADESARWKQERLAIFDAIAGQLELTTYQKTVGRQHFESLSLSRLTTAQIDTALVAIMVAAIVARPDGRLYHPNRAANNNDPVFVDLLTDLGYDDSSILRSAYGKVVQAVSE